MTTTLTTAGALPAHGTASAEGKRPTQEDRSEVLEFLTADGMRAVLALVADGIGGQNTGERASFLAVTTISHHLTNQPPATSEIPAALRAAFEEANRAIYLESLEAEGRAGMGTTCTAVVVVGQRLYLAHAGDSRAYLLRGGALRQLSIDHTWAEEELRLGNRTLQEIRSHPNRGVIKRYLGIEPQVDMDSRYRSGGAAGAEVDSAETPLFLEAGDTLLLCSDGLSDSLDDARLLQTLQRKQGQQAADALVQAAVRAGASDNVTAVVLDMPGSRKKAAPVVPVRLAAALVGVLALAAVGVLAYASLGANGSGDDASPVVVAQGGSGTPTATSTPLPPVILDTTSIVIIEATQVPEVTTAPGDATPGGETGEPTATLVPTNTPTIGDTATPMPAPATPTAGGSPVMSTPTPTPRLTASRGSVTLLQPPDNAVLSGQVTFAWSPLPGLAANEAYELVFWRAGQDAMQHGQSPVDAGKETLRTVNLADPPDWLKSGEWLWGVLLVNPEPYRRIAPLAPGHRLEYQPSTPSGTTTSPPATVTPTPVRGVDD